MARVVEFSAFLSQEFRVAVFRRVTAGSQQPNETLFPVRTKLLPHHASEVLLQE